MKELSEQDIAELLRPLCPFYYWPNNGNLGDLLIAEATRQWFEREGLEYKEFDDGALPDESQYNLVYGGGGRFTNHWPGVDAIARLLTAPQVRHCVILPHSLYCVDDFVRSLDERHTIICREKRSFEYCCGLSPRASVALGNDMALLADARAFSAEAHTGDSAEAQRLYAYLQGGAAAEMAWEVKNATILSTVCGKQCRVAFVLRTDKEKNTQFASELNYDISLVWSSSCRYTPGNSALMHAFANAMAYPDVVVTDRLHVGIISAMLGKQVYLLDNDYGKLSSVYQQSLSQMPAVHLLKDGLLTPDLERAWKRLNSPTHRLSHCMAKACHWMLGK